MRRERAGRHTSSSTNDHHPASLHQARLSSAFTPPPLACHKCVCLLPPPPLSTPYSLPPSLAHLGYVPDVALANKGHHVVLAE